MQKEELGMDENRNPEEELRLLGGKKEKCHSLSNRIRTGNVHASIQGGIL